MQRGYRPRPALDRAGDETEMLVMGPPPGRTWLDWHSAHRPDDVETVLPRDTPGDCLTVLDPATDSTAT